MFLLVLPVLQPNLTKSSCGWLPVLLRHKSEKKKNPELNVVKLHNVRVIRKVTLCSPCLWASFHPLSPPFGGIHKVNTF